MRNISDRVIALLVLLLLLACGNVQPAPPDGRDVHVTGDGMRVGASLWLPAANEDSAGHVNMRDLFEETTTAQCATPFIRHLRTSAPIRDHLRSILAGAGRHRGGRSRERRCFPTIANPDSDQGPPRVRRNRGCRLSPRYVNMPAYNRPPGSSWPAQASCRKFRSGMKRSHHPSGATSWSRNP